ncbi:hypothetical protein [Staphylococcus argensis]|uniref:DeoR-like transcriptional repressor C-terminal sensor domain-containing protein n=1 Tax=Staphylococcus argensis TaxID=1607738 RepID=A0A2K4FEV0_9STAP|nr:hypothetical protein [Staphylococcus argensis]MCY6990370.1 hypothetical protein [Staphylococcus argensis]POA09884.1 hypothetical protein CD039_03820 [Staphylococcus argensis]
MIIGERNIDQLTKMISNSSVIAFDDHPLSIAIIDHLEQQNKKISVITFSTDIISHTVKYTNHNIIFSNARVERAKHSLVGFEVSDTFQHYLIDYYFCNVPYLYKDALYQSDSDIASLQQQLIKQSRETVLVNFPNLISLIDNYSYITKLNK